MKYELAKELKDVGFVFTENQGCATFVNKDESVIKYRQIPADGHNERIPNLSELIEACGKDLSNLTRLRDYWVCNFDDDYNCDGDSNGDTPEEAVARLWLALNDKQHEI